MANKDLFKQAIAEAKSIREAAIANAKDALEETLTPHLKDMLAAKLQEMESEEIAEETVTEAPAKEKKEEGKHKKEESVEEEVVAEEETIEEETIEEAEEEVKESEEVNEEEAIEEETVEEAEVTAEAEDDSEESEDEAEEEDEDLEVKDMDVDDLKGLIRDLIAQEMGGDHGEEEGLEDEAPAEEEEINLEALLEELEATTDEGKDKKEESVEEEVTEEEVTNEEEVTEEETLNEISPEAVEMLQGLAGAVGVIGGSAGLATLMQNAKDGKYGDKVKKLAFGLEKAGSAAGGAIRHNMGQREEVELNEALETIETLRTELSEVNLLNAKLLYVNKVFKSNDLSESQKVNVIAAFDKAETVKEVKLVYETVADNVVAKKANIKEHKNLGQASKATGTTASKPEVIAEVSDAVLRMQKLAGIIK